MTIENNDVLLVNRGSDSYQIKYEKIKQDIEDNTNQFPEAPEDGKQYGRQDAGWTEIVHTPEYTDADVDTHLNTKYFMKGYDGELTAEAIREAAVEAQLIRDAQAEQVQAEAQTWNRSTQMAADSSNEPPVDWGQRISNAKNAQEVEALLAEAKAAQQI